MTDPFTAKETITPVSARLGGSADVPVPSRGLDGTGTKALTTAELDLLALCEDTIERGLKTFVETGNALASVRDNRLYRAEFDTFENYCAERWGISRPRAYELMAAADVVSAIGRQTPDLPTPTNERQARELAKVPGPERADVWTKAHEATGGKPTAAAVRDVVNARDPKPADGRTPSSANAGTLHQTPGLDPGVSPSKFAARGGDEVADGSTQPLRDEPSAPNVDQVDAEAVVRDVLRERRDEIAAAAAHGAELRRQAEWAREYNANVDPAVIAHADEIGRRLDAVAAIADGCEHLLRLVEGIDPQRAVAEAHDSNRRRLDVVHAAIGYLTRVADAMNTGVLAA